MQCYDIKFISSSQEEIHALYERVHHFTTTPHPFVISRTVKFKASRFSKDEICCYERHYREPRRYRFRCVACVCESFQNSQRKRERKKKEKNHAPGSPIISPRAAELTIFDPLSKFGLRSPSTFVRRVPYETIGRYLLSFHVERCPQGGHLYVLRESFDGLAGFAVPETDTKGEPQRTRMDAPLTRVRFQWPRRD